MLYSLLSYMHVNYSRRCSKQPSAVNPQFSSRCQLWHLVTCCCHGGGPTSRTHVTAWALDENQACLRWRSLYAKNRPGEACNMLTAMFIQTAEYTSPVATNPPVQHYDTRTGRLKSAVGRTALRCSGPGRRWGIANDARHSRFVQMSISVYQNKKELVSAVQTAGDVVRQPLRKPS